MSDRIYNTIGAGYNATRKADPYITERLIANLQPGTKGLYLDIGCGTGNYLHAMMKKGYSFTGIDPSETMLETARRQCPGATLVQGKAEHIAMPDASFDGAMGVFTLHHWQNKQQGINELYRVLKKGARLVFLSFTAEQMLGYWLHHYFPVMIEQSGAMIPGEPEMKEMLVSAGFTGVTTEKYFVHEGLQDHFLYSNKYRPERYLEPETRKGISSFAAVATAAEVEHGLSRLANDIATGEINKIIARYENEMGDYLFYTAIK